MLHPFLHKHKTQKVSQPEAYFPLGVLTLVYFKACTLHTLLLNCRLS